MSSVSRSWKPSGLLVVALLLIGAAGLAAQQAAQQNAQPQGPTGPPRDDSSISHSRGQSVIPLYDGWHPNTDGTIDLWFGYISDNWHQEVDVPIGANNNVSAPYGPDAGQPTHFLPRNNRYLWKITVPGTFGKNEVIWTLTTAARTYRVYATLDPSYVRDDSGMQREHFGSAPQEGNAWPEITLQGPKTRRLRVGEYSEMVYSIKDDFGHDPRQNPNGGTTARPTATQQRQAANTNNRARQRPSVCGTQAGNAFFCGEPNEGGGNLGSVKGLRTSCYLYRGDPEIRISSKIDLGQATLAHFDPPQEKVFEDHRGGSPWATGYQLPTLPKDLTWHTFVSFVQPGTFVVRCQAHDGSLLDYEDLTFEVTQ